MRSEPFVLQFLKMRIRFEVQPSALLLAALGLLILPTDWLLSGILASAVHETGHLLVLWFFHVRKCVMVVTAGGAKIMTGFLTPMQELLCAAAGPGASFLLVFLWRWFPLIALFGLIQGLFNLMPVFPLDGGRILRCILIQIFPAFADLWMRRISAVWILISIGVLLRYRMSGWIVLIGFLMAGKMFTEKFLAKRHRNRYNGSD